MKMGTVKISDESIWLKHIEGDDALRTRIASMKADEELSLEIGGIVGRWQRMRDGRDGRPTLGIKPMAAMKDVWARWRRERTGTVVDIREVVSAEDYLEALNGSFAE